MKKALAVIILIILAGAVLNALPIHDEERPLPDGIHLNAP